MKHRKDDRGSTRPGTARAAVALLAAGLLVACGGSSEPVPSGLTYSTNPGIYTVGSAIAPNAPTITGGAIGSYAVAPALPAGLALNPTTGVISGTPTTPTARTVYTITASTGSGSTTAAVTLGVPGFVATGSMKVARSGFTATLLPGGKVLVAGGANGEHVLSSAELYDPATGLFTATGSMVTPRHQASAVLLATGKVLVAGGTKGSVGDLDDWLRSAELYDPETGRFTATGDMTVPHVNFATALLPNGTVLVVGGPWMPSTAEVYDPSTGRFRMTGCTTAPQDTKAFSVLLPTGKVLVWPGIALFMNLFDAATGTFTATGNMIEWRTASRPAALLLANGQVLVVGGNSHTPPVAEIHDPATGRFSATGSLNTARGLLAASLLPSGKVLVAGGYGTSHEDFLASTEIYDPAAGTFAAAQRMGTARAGHAAVLLPNGAVLEVGGYDSGGALASAELYFE